MNKIIETVNGLTEMEKKCFDYFCLNYQDLESNLEDNANYIDFDDCTEVIPANQLRGVFSSLKKKKLIFFAECDPSTYYLSGLAVSCWFYLFAKDEFNKCDKKILEQYI